MEAGQAINFAGIVRDEQIVFKLTYRGDVKGVESDSQAEARRLIEANGGKMQVDGAAGEGVTISCVFLLAQSEDAVERDDAR
jgi:hypothetical protein